MALKIRRHIIVKLYLIMHAKLRKYGQTNMRMTHKALIMVTLTYNKKMPSEVCYLILSVMMNLLWALASPSMIQ